MGIKHLNYYIKKVAKNAVIKYNLSDLTGKYIVVDINIYMHKFVAEGSIIEQMYTMLSVFKYYNIIPIFIFDGTPPTEKERVLCERKINKNIAENEYTILEQKIQDIPLHNVYERNQILNDMKKLKRQFARVCNSDIEVVKLLITIFGFTYYNAIGEADEVCALLCIRNKVWACLSEDMDMFVYGCPRVIRYLSLIHHTVYIYDTFEILSILKMSQHEFRQVCILSGTDYNSDNLTDYSLETIIEYFNVYKKTFLEHNENDFYKWLSNHSDIKINIELLNNTYTFFETSKCDTPDIQISNIEVDKNKLYEVLKTDGFIM